MRERVFRIGRHGLIEVIERFLEVVACALVPEKSPFETKLVSCCALRRPRSDRVLFGAGEFRLQTVGDFFRDFAFDRKNIRQLTIIFVGPKMRIVLCIDQLNVDAHLIGRFLNGPFHNVGHAKSLRNFGEIVRRALVMSCRRSRNDFQVRNFRQAREDFFLNAIGEIRGVGFAAKIFEGQNGNRFALYRLSW